MDPRRRKMLIAAGMIALAGLAYLWWSRRSSSGASGTSPFSTGDATTAPAAAGDAGGGSGGGSGAPPDTSTADLLASLQGENQALLGQLLGSQQNLLAFLSRPGGGSGAPPTLPPSPVPVGLSTTTESQGLAPVGVSAPVANSYTGFTAQSVLGGTVYTPTTAEATVINASPNALRTIGSDAAQSAVRAPSAPARPAGTGGRVIQSQVKARSL